MDPTANLREQRDLTRAIQEIQDAAADDGTLSPTQLACLEGYTFRLAELVASLDQWLVQGGFLPEPWTRDRNPNGMTIIARADDAIYIRLPRGLQRRMDTSPCQCTYCKAHPGGADWDTLVVPITKTSDTTWTCHAPDAQALREGLTREKGKGKA